MGAMQNLQLFDFSIYLFKAKLMSAVFSGDYGAITDGFGLFRHAVGLQIRFRTRL